MSDTDEKMIPILDKKYCYIIENRHIDILKYYPRNPRIAARISEAKINTENMTDDEIQAELEKLMCSESSVKNLIPEIINQGGVTDEILVNYHTSEVIEGNSRLAAMRQLHKKHGDPDEWNMLPCKLVRGLTQEAIDAYLIQTHVKGKTPWSAYEKANTSYMRIVEEKCYSLEQYCKISNQTRKTVQDQIKSIQQMNDNNDAKRDNFSYYEVMMKNSIISKELDKNIELQKNILLEIKSDKQNFTAQELRKKLPPIIESKKNLQKFITGKETLHGAFDLAQKIKPIEKIKYAQRKISDIEAKQINKAEIPDLNSLEIEIRRCRQALERVNDMVKVAKNKSQSN